MLGRSWIKNRSSIKSQFVDVALAKSTSGLMGNNHVNDRGTINQGSNVNGLIFALHNAPIKCLVDDGFRTGNLTPANVRCAGQFPACRCKYYPSVRFPMLSSELLAVGVNSCEEIVDCLVVSGQGGLDRGGSRTTQRRDSGSGVGFPTIVPSERQQCLRARRQFPRSQVLRQKDIEHHLIAYTTSGESKVSQFLAVRAQEVER